MLTLVVYLTAALCVVGLVSFVFAMIQPKRS
jgi:hypothetical protein